MRNCEQTKGQSILDHGLSVKNYLFDLINHLRNETPFKYEWILPDWIYPNKDIILSSLPDDETLKMYTIFHDCGKWACLTIDSEGKRHFPDHAKVSHDIFRSIFSNDIAADLILHDMDIHLLKSENIKEFSTHKYATTLLLAGIAELHSNSNMFGGINSLSFLIKKKQLFKRGKAVIEIIKNLNKK
jgi:hypothetical protein